MGNPKFIISNQNEESISIQRVMEYMIQHELNSLSPEKFFMLFCRLLIFFQNQLFEKFFQEYHLSVNRLDPVQARHIVGPDLGPNCKGYQQMTLGGKELRCSGSTGLQIKVHN